MLPDKKFTNGLYVIKKKLSAFQETKELSESEQLREGKVLRGVGRARCCIQRCQAIGRGMGFIYYGLGAMLKKWRNIVCFFFVGLNFCHCCNKTSDESNLNKGCCLLAHT